MKTEIKEVSKMPNFILILFAIQLIVFLFLFIKSKSSGLEIFYILLPVTLILSLSKMTLILNTKTFKYKLFPIHFGYKVIEWSQIKQIQISKVNALTDFSGWGFRYSRKYGWGYIFKGNDAVLITFNNDKKIVITIKDKEAITKFLTNNQIPFNT
jgi:hypothetical protein